MAFSLSFAFAVVAVSVSLRSGRAMNTMIIAVFFSGGVVVLLAFVCGGGLFVCRWSVFLLAVFSVVLLSAFAFFLWYTVFVGSGGAVFPVWLPVSALSLFLLGVFVVSVRSGVVSSVVRGSVLLLPGFAWSPVSSRGVGSRCRRWVPVWSPALLPSPRPVPSPSPVPPVVASGASGSGSVLFLSSPAFLSAVSSGRCPVALSLSVFSHWPLRSAVLGSLCRVLASSRVRSFLASPVARPAVRSFCVAALSSLGFGVSGRFLSRLSSASEFLLAFRSAFAVVPSFRCVGVSSRALVSALVSLSRCLRWLSRRSGRLVSCPLALRALVARLAFLLLPVAV